MVKEIKLFIVIDWGFTRLKFWVINIEGIILNHKSIYLQSLNPNPKFYNLSSLEKIAFEILDFINKSITESSEISILSSTQMHSVSGISDKNLPFISTWNDLPSNLLDKKIYSINGQPTLSSMPINKIKTLSNDYLLETEFIKNNLQKEFLIVKTFMTPIQLIFNYFLGQNLKPSNYLWESTCLPLKLINSDKNYDNYAESACEIIQNSKFKIAKRIKLFPELGDLQASTYSSLLKCDIVLNLGTGSQIIYKGFKNIKNLNFYRRFPNLGDISVISHIPCGRLFSEYCKSNKYDYKQLLTTFNTERGKIIDNLKSGLKGDLLFFPGFDIHKLQYTNKPNISIKKICKLSPEILISLWIQQYKNLIDMISKDTSKSEITIAITGSLGGISNELIVILKKIYPNNFVFKKNLDILPYSILKSTNIFRKSEKFSLNNPDHF